MKGLISRKSYRLLNILDYVLRERKPIDIDEVMAMNHCSKKTVYNDLEEIKERTGLDLSNFYYADANNTYNVYQFMIMKRKVLHHETSIHLLVELFFNPNQDLVDLSLATGKSESNVRTHLSRLEKYVKEHRLKLVYDKEEKYRLDFEHLFSASLFISDLMRIAGHESYLPPIPKERLEKAVFFEKGSSLIEKDFQRMYHTLICAQHLYPQFPIVSLEEFVKPYKEKIQLYLATQREALQKFVIDHDLDIASVNLDYVMTILISAYMKKDLQPYPVDVLMNRYDYFYLDASLQKPKVVEIFDEFMGTFFVDEMSLSSYETEVFFNLYNEIGWIQKIQKRLIGVYSDIGYAHAQTLCEEIKKIFTIHETEAYDPMKEYDLIVSTSFLPKAPKDTPVVLIDDYINPLEVHQIYSALYQNTYPNNQKEGLREKSNDRR